ncbi:MAG: sulfite exporter TauE/SafE family protein, partial [Schleiferiaceae bacterium]|nr:sulfite exporter TauE/SafE family protein [Schleiferiaceae bacterium]
YIVGGFAAGIINTLAGNGSAITLSLLMAFGMSPNVANATNRVGILPQALSAVLSLKKTKRTKKLFFDSFWFFIPISLGSILGAFLAIDIDPELLKKIIGVLMIGILITLVKNPKKWLINTDIGQSKKTLTNFSLFFAIGVYGGFIQMGIGILLLTALVLVAKYSLRDGNVIKLVLALVLIIPSFFVFLSSGQIQWIPGLSIAIGSSAGGFFAARYLLNYPNINLYIRYLLILLLVTAISFIFKLPQLFAQLVLY